MRQAAALMMTLLPGALAFSSRVLSAGLSRGPSALARTRGGAAVTTMQATSVAAPPTIKRLSSPETC